MPERYEFEGFVLERSQQRVLRSDGTELSLTPRLYAALLLFVENAGLLLEKDTLMQALWPGLVVEENNLSQTISSLRHALGEDPPGAYFSDRGRPNQSDRGRCFSVIVDGLGRRASPVVNVA